MFYISLFVSIMVLGATFLVFQYFEGKKDRIALIVVAVVPSVCISSFSIAVIVQWIVLLLLMIGASYGKWHFRTFAANAVGITTVIYVIIVFGSFREVDQYRKQREQMTQELVSERVPAVKQKVQFAILPSESKDRLKEFEDKLFDSSSFGRDRALHALHNQTTETFVNSPGFGVGRGVPRGRGGHINLELPPPISQPAPLSESDRAYSLVGTQPADELRPGLSAFHLGSLLGFANARGFGILTEDKRLFGFQPHHFRELPDNDDWQVRSLELVGLLVHEEPCVYETKELPRMDKIRDIPTRPVDAFEAAGLETFKKGEDMYVRTMPLGVRMLGAIRSVEQCVKCHGGERGDLLGAFSYSLQKKK